MSSFNCEHCSKPCIDTDFGYVTGCEHYPADQRAVRKYIKHDMYGLLPQVTWLLEIAEINKHPAAGVLRQFVEHLTPSEEEKRRRD